MKGLTKNKFCRICKKNAFTKVFSFGLTPLANAFLKKSQLKKKEYFYPLDVYFCHNCHLLQLRDIVSPKILFKNYVYVSSTSPVFIKHFNNFAQDAIKRFSLNKKSLVIDIGSNDGILLKPFKKRGIQVLGIEPAKNIAALANKEETETIPEFFSVKLAERIGKMYGFASLVTATNVIAHINDLHEVVIGVKSLLGKEGVFMIEAPSLIAFLENNLFDTVYHEHLSYLAVSPLMYLFNQFDMKIFSVERVASHGGSIRVFTALKNSSHTTEQSVANLLTLEKKLRLDQISTYKAFAKRVEKNKKDLLRFLNKLKKQGNTIAGYGAPAKGNTLLNYFGITTNYLDYIVDDSIYKQGLLTPGTHIPIVPSGKIYEEKPEYILILAWNFAKSIMKTHTQYQKEGGKFIIPVPRPRII